MVVFFYLYEKFFVLTLLIGWQEGHLTCKNLPQQLAKSLLVIYLELFQKKHGLTEQHTSLCLISVIKWMKQGYCCMQLCTIYEVDCIVCAVLKVKHKLCSCLSAWSIFNGQESPSGICKMQWHSVTRDLIIITFEIHADCLLFVRG